MLRFVGWCLLLATVGVLPLWAQPASVRGVVVDAAYEQPLAGVQVTVEQEGRVVAGTVTDADGAYRLRGVPAGRYRLVLRYVGYRTEERAIAVDAANEYREDARLMRSVAELGEVAVEAGVRDDPADVAISVTRIEPEQIRQVAGGTEDVLRALQTLPGIVSASDYTNQLIVRGGSPDQNLILIDGIEVYSPYRLSGVGSVLNPAMLRSVELYAGGFPARYGDRLSSVLAVTMRDGTTTRPLAGTLSLDPVHAGLTLEGRLPMAGSWLVSGRRTYFDTAANTFADRSGIANDLATPTFTDVQARLLLQPGQRHRLRLTALRSREVLDSAVDVFGEQEGTASDLMTGDDELANDALGLTWTYLPRADRQWSVLLSGYRLAGANDAQGRITPADGFRPPARPGRPPPPPLFGGEVDTAQFALTQDYRLEQAAVRTEFAAAAGAHTVEAGAGLYILRHTLDVQVDLNAFGAFLFDALQTADPLLGALTRSTDTVRTTQRAYGYAQDRLALSENAYVQPGLRYDYYGLLRRGYLSPRLGVSARVGPATTVRVAAGHYAQAPGYEKLIDPSEPFSLGRFTRLDGLKAEEAVHLGVEVIQTIGPAWQVRVEAYDKWLRNLIAQQLRLEQRPVARYTGRAGRLEAGAYDIEDAALFVATTAPINAGQGRARGVELMVERRPGAWWSGWFAYTYARAERERFYADGLVAQPFAYDRRHAATLVLDARLGRGFRLGLTWRAGSGLPTTRADRVTPLVGVVDDPVTGTENRFVLTDPASGTVRLVPDYGDAADRFDARLPSYHRLDLRATYTAPFEAIDASIYLDLINVYNRRNTLGYQYYVAIEPPPEGLPASLTPPPKVLLYREPVYLFPFIPAFGLRIAV